MVGNGAGLKRSWVCRAGHQAHDERVDGRVRSEQGGREGQAQWKKTREAVLRRRQEAEAHAKAEQVEAEAVKSYTKQRRRSAPIVAEWAEQHYEKPGAVPR